MTKVSQEIEILLSEKINDFGQYLISNTNDTNKQNVIKNALIDLPSYKILLFISYLDSQKIESHINDFINLFGITSTDDTRNEIKKYLQYFFQIQNIIKK